MPSWECCHAKHIANAAEHQAFLHLLEKYKSSLLDSGATGNYNKESDYLEVIGPSNKEFMVAFGQTSRTMHQAKLPMTQLSDNAHQTDILPALANNSLLSIKVLSDNG